MKTKSTCSLDAKKAEVADKLFILVGKDTAGNPRYARSNEKLTLDETAIALAMAEGADKPLSRMTIRTYVQTAISKLRVGFNAEGIHDMSDLFDQTCNRKTASIALRPSAAEY